MLIILTLWLLRKVHFIKYDFPNKWLKIFQQLNFKKGKIIGALVLIMPITILQAQKTNLEYTILKGGNKVGTFYFSRLIHKDKSEMTFRAESTVNTRLVFPVKVEVLEIAHYNKGILHYSSLNRKVNGSEKMNKWMKLNNKSYTITKGTKTTELNIYPIRRTILEIFCEEPVNTTQLYSNNYQQLIPVQKVEEHKYKASFPDGNYNYYYFKNGFCTKVEVHHSLYSLQFVLNKTFK